VIPKALAGPSDFWCAAADYADRRLGHPPTGRVYILGQRGRAPLFTIVAYPEVAEGRRPGEGGRFGLSLKEVGFNMQLAQARNYCRDSLRRMRGLRF
jgi:hypothetical protein